MKTFEQMVCFRLDRATRDEIDGRIGPTRELKSFSEFIRHSIRNELAHGRRNDTWLVQSPERSEGDLIRAKRGSV